MIPPVNNDHWLNSNVICSKQWKTQILLYLDNVFAGGSVASRGYSIKFKGAMRWRVVPPENLMFQLQKYTTFCFFWF